LYILDLLQDENFRVQATKPNFITLLLDQQNFHWKYYRTKRLAEEASQLGAAGAATLDDAMQTDPPVTTTPSSTSIQPQ